MHYAVLALVLAACAPPDDTPAPPDTPAWPEGVWNKSLPATATLDAPRGHRWKRAVFHLHSPYSHDACDGHGFEDGVLDEACRDDLRAALCDDRFDVAWLTDHPDYADAQPFEALFHPQGTDRWVEDAGELVGLEIACEDGHRVLWQAGFEDELMPVGLRRHVDEDPATRHDLLNRSDTDALDAMRAAGAHVLMAHTESKPVDYLRPLQDAGLHAVEAYNLHAMLAPNLRGDYLGLDPGGWILDLAPFTRADTDAEPDLLFLAVHQEQAVTLRTWDALLAEGPMMATAGSDAHQNVLQLALSDGERVDSYRRTLRWFSTFLLADGDGLDAIHAAVSARRAMVVFEALGTPAGFDLHLEGGDGLVEMGGEGGGETLVVACPTLADGSPYGPEAPEITVRVLRDGLPWQEGCGRFPVGAGVYRVEVWMTPRHLRPFFGEAAAALAERSFPWIYSGAVRVGGG